MDLTTIDVTDIRKVQQGDEVVLLGRQGAAEISADEMAAWANTISYEIFTSIGARVPRIHIQFLGGLPAVGRIERALISVSDKKGIVEFSRALAELDIELVSTGGTASLAARQ